MHWAKTYYTQQSETFARAVVTDAHRAIAQRLHGWCEVPGGGRILELGAGMGGTAAALADLGHRVCAIEFNASDAALARTLAEVERPGELRVVEEDFYDVHLDDRYDLVFYWDGFGIGTDADQRQLLTRIGREWLTPGGCAIIDVFSPWNWQRQAGQTSTYTARDGSVWQRRLDFDAVGNRLVDFWQGPDDDEPTRSQTIRCYAIPDLLMLLEGTGLRIGDVYAMDGTVIDSEATSPAVSATLLETNGYVVRLEGE